MSEKLTISETGLKLIKAFEGYRPVDRELVTGQRIVGYGHRLYSEDAVMMSKNDAEELLRSDLEPFEDMINTKVHAPISQSQFDALCSFAFNIGPKAFLQSDTLRALNNGRHLDAANGLDVWRKSEIAGKTYVVDALMRRRTAEKALFLRTEKGLAAGREDLPPVKDTTIEGLSTEDAYPVFTEADAEKIVSAPYSARISPARRREDGPAGVLQLSELDILDDKVLLDVDTAKESNELTDLLELDESLVVDEQVIPNDLQSDVTSELDAALPADETVALDVVEDIDVASDDNGGRSSPIAAAASDIVARLDALIDDADAGFEDRDKDWPDTLVEGDAAEDDASETDASADIKGQVIDLNTKAPRSEAEASESASNGPPTLVIDELAADDAMRPRTDSAAKYIETYSPKAEVSESKKEKHLDSWILLSLGFILLGMAGGTMIRGSQVLLGTWGPIIAVTGFVIGLCLIILGVYAYLRNLRSLKHKHK